MKTLYKTLFFVLFLFSITLQAQSILDNYEGIPIETNLDWWNIEDIPLSVDSMDSAGVDIIHLSFPEYANLQSFFSTSNFDVLPMTTPKSGGVYNWIQYYTDAKYSVWEAEGNPPSEAKLEYYDSVMFKPFNEDYISLKPEAAGRLDTLIWGPYYHQDVEYETYEDGNPDSILVYYTADFKLKLDTIGIDNANSTDTLCILQVTQSNIDTSPNWHLPCTDVIKDTALTRADFTNLNSFKSYPIRNYSLENFECEDSYNTNIPPPQYRFSSETGLNGKPNGPRWIREYIQFKVIWLGNPNYSLSIDKVIVSDGRGLELFGEDSIIYRNSIIDQSNSLSDYSNSLFGWLGIDEPVSIDLFEPIRIVDSLLNAQPIPKRLVIPFMGSYTGYWNELTNPYGVMHLSKWQEFKKRVGPVPILQNAYMFDTPCLDTSPPEHSLCWTGEGYKSINIRIAAENNFKLAYEIDPNFGASLQCGSVYNAQANQRNVARHELLYSANLALMYGAKYLQLWRYFPAAPIDDTSGTTTRGIVDWTRNGDIITPIYTDKYFMLKDTLSPRLKGLFGKTLRQLFPDTSKILGINILVHPDYSSSSSYIDYIESVGSESDTCVIDLGFFTDPADNSVDYFMPINRYYSTLNYITFGLKNLSENSNWKITDFVDTTQFTALSVNGLTEYTDTITPGDAKLYSVAPVVKYGGLLAYNDTIKVNTTLSENMTIDAGKVLQINEGKTYTITDTITFTDTSSFITGYGYINRTQNGWITTRSWNRSLFKGRSGSHPKLIWSKHPDITNVINYNIYRNHSNGGWQYLTTKTSSTFEYIDSTITIIEGMPQANETSTQYRITATYRPTRDFVETSPSNTILYHRVEGGGLDKKSLGINQEIITYNLDQNYPNPFNPTTTISYSIAEDGLVELEIMNILGERIKTLVNEFKTKGNHNISFNASSLASGVYVYKLQAGDFVSSKKMILLK